jgi:hypothetical protein
MCNQSKYVMIEESTEYEPPQLAEIGSIEEVTGADKTGSGDGNQLAPLGS